MTKVRTGANPALVPTGLSNPALKADNPIMLSPRVFQLWAVALTVAFSALTLWAAKEFVMPHAENASTYPCKDAHPTEKVTMAVEVYNTPPKA